VAQLLPSWRGHCPDASSKEAVAMSQQNVGNVIHRLLTDEELRIRFALDRFDALAELHVRGLALTPDEMDVFVQSDVKLWFGENESCRGRLH
jgi:hypothetical protein